MPKKRITKKKTNGKRVIVCKAQLDRLAHLGASHHKTLQQLKASAYTLSNKPKKSTKKKVTKKRKKVTKKVGKKRRAKR